jgi:hypothetical protein
LSLGVLGVRLDGNRKGIAMGTKRVLVLLSVLSAAAVWLGGCAAEPSHVSGPGPHGPQCAVIQSASEIGFSGDRAAALMRVAQEPGLSEHEQCYLIDATLVPSGYSSDKANVLSALAGNPSLTQGAREHMADRLRGAGLFSDDQKRVTEAMAAGVRRNGGG